MAIHTLFSEILLIQTYHYTCVSVSVYIERMRTMSNNMMGNKLIGQSLANKRQRETPASGNVYMQISYACVVLLFHSQRFRKIRNDTRKDS